MEYKTKRSPLTISLLLAATFAAGFGAALLTTTMQDITANASILADATETKESVAKSNNSAINLAEKPFLVEQGKTVAVTPINVTHIQISLAGNGTIMLPNSTETVKTKDTGNAIARSTPTGNIAQGQIFINTEDRSENGTVFLLKLAKMEKELVLHISVQTRLVS